MSYTAPNPYVEGVPYKGNTNTSNSLSVMGMLGITPNGDTTKAVLVTSWTEYIEKFALGVSTPFATNSMLSYAVYGFFQNGGSLLYVGRVVGSGAKKATVTDSTSKLKFTAKSEGEWGNKIKVTITANSSDTENPFTISVHYGEDLVEMFPVSASASASNYYVDTVNDNSMYIDIDASTSGATLGAVAKTDLAEGADDLSNIKDTTYETALTMFDKVHNLAGISIPGQTAENVIAKLIEYTKGKPILPVFELSSNFTNVSEILTFVKTNYKGKDIGVYGPNIKVIDPLSATGKVKEIPPSGHILGAIARTIDKKGEWFAPAGTDAVLKGVVGVAAEFTDEERGKLNDAGVNVILVKPNYGTVIWGARSMSSDPKLKFIPNLTLDYSIRREINDAMQKFEFRNNNEALWVDIAADISGIMETKRLAGAFAGTTKEESYFVVCDSTINTQATIDKGQVICDVGYAANNPAEFIIVRVAHQLN